MQSFEKLMLWLSTTVEAVSPFTAEAGALAPGIPNGGSLPGHRTAAHAATPHHPAAHEHPATTRTFAAPKLGQFNVKGRQPRALPPGLFPCPDAFP